MFNSINNPALSVIARTMYGYISEISLFTNALAESDCVTLVGQRFI
jgi:hypothetical protein